MVVEDHTKRIRILEIYHTNIYDYCEQLGFCMTKQLEDRLFKYAKDNHISMNSIIRYALDKTLSEIESKGTIE